MIDEFDLDMDHEISEQEFIKCVSCLYAGRRWKVDEVRMQHHGGRCVRRFADGLRACMEGLLVEIVSIAVPNVVEGLEGGRGAAA